MAVQFVIGRAGSGKTFRCFNDIVGAMRADPLGPPIYWVLPKQATFSAERELTCGSGLGGFCRAHVVSFDQLGREVLARSGGAVVPEVTPLGRQMILGHLLRRLQPRLRFFASSARQPGLAAELDATFAEFERSGKTAADLAALVAGLEGGGALDVDGASLLAIGNAATGDQLGLKARARILATAVSGSDPTIMLTGPAPASKKALAKAGLTVDDLDLVEINEAFAAVVLRFVKDMDLDLEKVNVNGGAIAMGHPLGATGGMILGTLIDELHRTGGRYGLATLCVGGGMGIATVIEAV